MTPEGGIAMMTEALGVIGNVDRSRGDATTTVTLTLPRMFVAVPLDEIHFVRSDRAAEFVMKHLEDGARHLFADVIEHIAKHDRSPLDRIKSLEVAATALLDAQRLLDDVRMPMGASSPVLEAAYKLRELLRSKPGAASWERNGYGPEPEGTPV